jgi:hypothetical protein
MSIYMYSLGFTVANAAAGNFLSNGNNANSDAWFMYNGVGTPPYVADAVQPVTTPLQPSQWTAMSGPPADFNAGEDYLLLRIFNVDGYYPLTLLNLRLTVVIGRGTSGQLPAGTNQQAPFMMGGNARPVVDCDNSPPTGWPNPTAADGAWTYCIGMFHGPTNYYSFNVGATVYVPTNGFLAAFGHDPQVHVKGTMGKADVAA